MVAGEDERFALLFGELRERLADGLAALPGVEQTPAGKYRNIIDMDDSVLLSFGPDTGKVLAALSDALYPQAQG